MNFILPAVSTKRWFRGFTGFKISSSVISVFLHCLKNSSSRSSLAFGRSLGSSFKQSSTKTWKVSENFWPADEQTGFGQFELSDSSAAVKI